LPETPTGCAVPSAARPEDGRTIALLTIIQEELDAVREVFALDGPKRDCDGLPYYEGQLTNPETQAGVRVVCYQALSRGNTEAFNVASHVLELWHPTHFLLIGIAGGILGQEGTQLGDVVVANDIAYYEMVKETEQGRYDRSAPGYRPTGMRWESCTSLGALQS
jgi:nucleoside phosphorylase